MNSKCVIISFGFDSSIVLRAYSEYQLSTGDTITLVTYRKENQRTTSAIKDVENFLSSLTSRGLNINLQVLTVEADNIERTVTTISDYIKKRNQDYHLEVSGGPRSICVSLIITGILLKPRIKTASTINEATGHRPGIPLPCLDYRMSHTKKKILQIIEQREKATAKQIANDLGRDTSTITRHLKELETQKLVHRDSNYNSQYTATYIAKAIANQE